MAVSTEDILELWFGAAPTDEEAVASHMRRWFGTDKRESTADEREYLEEGAPSFGQ